MSAQTLQLYSTLCDPVNCHPPGSSVHRILQARVLEWVAMPSSRGSFWPRDGTCVSWGSWIAGTDSSLLSHWESPSWVCPHSKTSFYSAGFAVGGDCFIFMYFQNPPDYKIFLCPCLEYSQCHSDHDCLPPFTLPLLLSITHPTHPLYSLLVKS